MQFQVPQFIDVEPKIVGPLTLKQFMYIAGAAIPAFALYFYLAFILWLIVAVILSGAAIVLAFVKFNGQPAGRMLSSALNFFWQPRFYLWRRTEESANLPKIPTSSRGALGDLLLKLTTTTKPIEEREVSSLPLLRKNVDEFEAFRKITGERRVARRVDYR